MKCSPISACLVLWLSLFPACEHLEGDPHSEEHLSHPIVVTKPITTDITQTEEYVCQIHSRRHIEVSARWSADTSTRSR